MLDTFRRLPTYGKIWLTVAKYALAETMINRWTSLLFFVGKSLRFSMLLLFLWLLKDNLNGFAGYTTDQVLVFFLTYQLTDTVTQIFFRGVYRFSWQVRAGELDFYLSKPLNPLFRILAGEPDLLDAFFFIPTTAISIWILVHVNILITPLSGLIFGVLLINSFLIAAAFHIFVLCLGIVTTEVDNAIMLYRDTTSLSRFPVNIYAEPLRTALFFLIPVGLMNTVPAQVLMNAPASYNLAVVISVGVGFFVLSLLTWNAALKRYSSAGG